MTSNKKSPESNNEASSKKSIKETLIDLAEEYFECWKPFLTIESSKFLGKILAIVKAEIAHLVRDNEILRASNKNLHDRVLHLELGYSQLCDAHDQNKQLHHEIGVRQKNHIERCDTNFAKIQTYIDRQEGK